MRVHHLNCGTMCPVSAKLVNGSGGLFAPGRMICHCLLVETNDGLVLVDTGLGLDDIKGGAARLGKGFMLATRAVLDPEETAVRQVERLGFKREDVRHIVPTHLDVDHAGGLADFPDATVHIYGLEHEAAQSPRTMREKRRYRTAQWAHGPKWDVLSLVGGAGGGDRWLGFESVRAVGPDVLLVPLLGHTKGHCGVAVKTDRGWLLHGGDAFFSSFEMLEPPSCPPALALFQRVAAHHNPSRLANQARLRELARDHASEVEIISAHCPLTFDRMSGVPVRTAKRKARGAVATAQP
jgi:glyoxylase-like metal-dependent hydrolase (beta-lactamase superfamily II)